MPSEMSQDIAIRLAEALFDGDGETDYIAVVDIIKPYLPGVTFARLCEALELCPVHVCDYHICADDRNPECDGGRRRVGAARIVETHVGWTVYVGTTVAGYVRRAEDFDTYRRPAGTFWTIGGPGLRQGPDAKDYATVEAAADAIALRLIPTPRGR